MSGSQARRSATNDHDFFGALAHYLHSLENRGSDSTSERSRGSEEDPNVGFRHICTCSPSSLLRVKIEGDVAETSETAIQSS